jgi:hypothetical protein
VVWGGRLPDNAANPAAELAVAAILALRSSMLCRFAQLSIVPRPA